MPHLRPGRRLPASETVHDRTVTARLMSLGVVKRQRTQPNHFVHLQLVVLGMPRDGDQGCSSLAGTTPPALAGLPGSIGVGARLNPTTLTGGPAFGAAGTVERARPADPGPGVLEIACMFEHVAPQARSTARGDPQALPVLDAPGGLRTTSGMYVVPRDIVRADRWSVDRCELAVHGRHRLSLLSLSAADSLPVRAGRVFRPARLRMSWAPHVACRGVVARWRMASWLASAMQHGTHCRVPAGRPRSA